MKRKVNPELLAECLDGIRSDRRAPDECLEMHPEATELRPLLETALSIVPMPVDFDPGFRIRGRVALIEAIRAEEEVATKSLWRRFWEAATGPWCRPAGASAWRVPVPAIILAAVFMLTASLGGGATYASQAALPGDTLYQVKTALEGVQVVFAMSDEARAQLNAECAGKRLDEAARAVQMGRAEAAHLAAQIYGSCVAQAEQHLAQAAASGRDVNELANLLLESLARQQATLATLEERVPEPAKAALARAAEEAEKGLTTAVSIVQRENARAGRRSPDQVPAIANTVPVVKPTKGPDRHPEPKDAPANRPAATVTVSSTVAVSLTQMISDVSNLARDPVNDLAWDPEFSGSSYKGLLSKLEASRAALERGQNKVASNNLDAFLNELNAMRRSDRISNENYALLYSEYAAVVNGLGGQPGTQAPPPPATKPEPKPERKPEPAQRPDDDDRLKERPSPSPAPTQAMRPSPTPEPEDSRDGPRGRPQDDQRRPEPSAVPTQRMVPPARTPEPEDSREDGDQRQKEAPEKPRPDSSPTLAVPTVLPQPGSGTNPGRPDSQSEDSGSDGR